MKPAAPVTSDFMIFQAQSGQGAECALVLNLANGTGDQLASLFSNSEISMAQLFGEVATITKATAASYAAMELADPQLQAFQADFVTVYSGISAASQQLSDAEQADDLAAAGVAFQDFRVATRPEGALIDAAINYCITGF